MLLQWAPMETWEDPMVTLTSLGKAISHVWLSLQEDIINQPAGGMAIFASNVAATCRGTGLASSIMPEEEIETSLLCPILESATT